MTDKEQERYNKDKASVIGMIRFILMALIIAVVCFFATKIAIILVPFLIGFLLAKSAYAIANPIVKFTYKKLKIKGDITKSKRKTTTVVYYILLILMAVACSYVIYKSIIQATNAAKAIIVYASTFNPTEVYEQLLKAFSGLKLSDEFAVALNTLVSELGTTVASKVPGLLSSLISGIWNTIGNIPYGIFVVVCIIFSGHYFINDSRYILKFYNKVIPHRAFRARVLSLVNNLSTTLFRALGGYVLLFLITAVEAYVILKIAGINYAIILSIVVGLVDFLPVLGVGATFVPLMIYSVLKGNWIAAIILVIGLTIITIVRRIVEPAILGKSLHLHPLLMLLSMMIGCYIWGAIGFLLGPTVIIIILDILKVFEFDKKITEYLTRVISNFMPKTKSFKKASVEENEPVEE